MKDWIVTPERQVLSSMRYGAAYKPHKIEPVEFLVYHYTAVNTQMALDCLTKRGEISCAECGGDGKLDNRRVCRMCRGEGRFENSARSAHFVVDPEGLVYQLAPLSERTWHAGGKTSKWRGKQNVNGRSIGIEIVNYGPLDERRTKLYDWVGHTKKGSVDIDEPYAAKDEDSDWWECYPEHQMLAVEDLTRELIREFPVLTDGRDRLTGHEHVDPTRKRDPGPLFPWHRIYDVQNETGSDGGPAGGMPLTA